MKRCACLVFVLLISLTASSVFAQPLPTTLYTAAAEPFKAYVAGPQTARTAVVLVHDWFGVSPFYTEAAERLAKRGYRVAAVDLYGGQHATTHETASSLLGTLRDDVAARELDAAIQSLAQGGRRVAIMGFSMGAKHALAAALRNRSVLATVLWYGETIRDPQQLRNLAGPVLLIAGSADGTATEDSAAFSKAADAAGVGAEIYVYPGAAHAFAQPLFNQGRTYDAAAADVAWRLSENFLQRRLR